MLVLVASLLATTAAQAASQLTIVLQDAGVQGARISGDGTALTFSLYGVAGRLFDGTQLVDISPNDLYVDELQVRAPVGAGLVIRTWHTLGPGEQDVRVADRVDAGVASPLSTFDPFGELWESAQPLDASADGSVVVGHDSGYQGYRWDGTTPNALPPLPGQLLSVASSISADGTVIGGFAWTSASVEAVLWLNGGSPTLLESLGGDGVFEWVKDVSADGTTAVGMSSSPAGDRAVRWIGTAVEPLGQLGGRGEATSVSGDGKVILGDSGGRPFIWAEGGDMRDLNAYLHDQTDAPLGSFVVDEAFIADDGLTLGGIGHFAQAEGGHAADVATAFVLEMEALPTPVLPALPIGGPTSLLLVTMALGALGARRIGRTSV